MPYSLSTYDRLLFSCHLYLRVPLSVIQNLAFPISAFSSIVSSSMWNAFSRAPHGSSPFDLWAYVIFRESLWITLCIMPLWSPLPPVLLTFLPSSHYHLETYGFCYFIFILPFSNYFIRRRKVPSGLLSLFYPEYMGWMDRWMDGQMDGHLNK